MRKADNDLKKKHQALPPELKKADSSKNSDNLEEVIQKYMQRQKRLYPLRINKTTVIYVTKNKCNEKYADEYRMKYGLISETKIAPDSKRRSCVNHDEIIRMYIEGMSTKKISVELGCIEQTVKRHIEQYKNSNENEQPD